MNRLLNTVILGLVFLALLGGTVAAGDFPPPEGWVTDRAGVMEAPVRQDLEALLEDLERETAAEVAVVTVETTDPLDPVGYGVRLFEEWGLGKAGADNGLLILLALREREIRVEVGYGLEHVLTDGLVGQLLDREAVPLLQEDRFGEGLSALAGALAAEIREAHASGLLEERPRAGDEARTRNPDFLVVAAFLVFWLLVGGAILAANRFRSRCPRCRNRLKTAQRTTRPAGVATWGSAVYSHSCPRCGYRREGTRRIPPIGTGRSRRMGGGLGFPRGGRAGGFGGFGGGRSGGGGAGRRF